MTVLVSFVMALYRSSHKSATSLIVSQNLMKVATNSDNLRFQQKKSFLNEF